MSTSPTGTYFLESVNTGTQGHTANWIADDIERIIQSLDKSISVAGAVTDNAAANKAAWKILEKQFPDKFFHGCVCHCLHLLVKDIFSQESQSR